MSKQLPRDEVDGLRLKAMAATNDGIVPVWFLGKTWVRRGAAYWSRRVGAVLLLVVLLGFPVVWAAGCIVAVILDGKTTPVRVALTVLYALTIIPGLLIGRRVVARAPVGAHDQPYGGVPAGLVAFVLAPIPAGVVLYVLLAMFGRDFIGERRAREASTLVTP
jgi:hypothetical protein